jgi:hypothetical protein
MVVSMVCSSAGVSGLGFVVLVGLDSVITMVLPHPPPPHPHHPPPLIVGGGGVTIVCKVMVVMPVMFVCPPVRRDREILLVPSPVVRMRGICSIQLPFPVVVTVCPEIS